MKKIIFTCSILMLTLVHAQIVDGIAMIVNGEAVTTTEIRAVQRQLRVSKQKAVDLLIQDRLQKAAMKEVSISDDSVDKKIAQIAAQNHVTIPKMQKLLKQRGTSWAQYRKSIKSSMKKQKFYKEKVAGSISRPSEDTLRIYYNHHKKEFVIPTSISLIEYSAASEDTLKKFLKTKSKKGIKSRSVKKSTKNLNPTMLGTLLRTSNGTYTQPFNAGDKFISYKVLSKNGRTTMPFESAKGAVAARWRQNQQGKALKDYFEKLKTTADVQVLR